MSFLAAAACLSLVLFQRKRLDYGNKLPFCTEEPWGDWGRMGTHPWSLEFSLLPAHPRRISQNKTCTVLPMSSVDLFHKLASALVSLPLICPNPLPSSPVFPRSGTGSPCSASVGKCCLIPSTLVLSLGVCTVPPSALHLPYKHIPFVYLVPELTSLYWNFQLISIPWSPDCIS